MRKELEEKLYEIAPQFLAEYKCDPAWSCMADGIECGDGWFEPLKRFCETVEAMINNSPNRDIVARQIKTKFGEMTVYWSIEDKNEPFMDRTAVEDEAMEHLMSEAVRNLMAECRMTCENCGSTKDVSSDRWLYVCKDCKEKNKKEGIWSGWNVTSASDSPSQAN